ncbi:MAG: GDYXXLXY domain-containing protein [Planctomycetota bacterium]|jgi:uncharacterized membrane-anchored protein|nr:GDYXXLXY domain-containing protein [Planctomycetota bacterium]
MRLVDLLRRPPAKYLCLAALPLAVLFYLPASRSIILAFGEPVLLETRPVDPRDWLRGDFVVLDYEIARQAAALASGGRGGDGESLRDEEIYVTLTKDGDGVGKVKEASRFRPADGLYLRGTLGGGRSSVDFGIGAYYVPEGTGGELERAVGVGLLADVRVLRGLGVIKALKMAAAPQKESWER